MKRHISTAHSGGTIKKRTLIERIVPLGTILIFCTAIVVLLNQFRSVEINAVFAFLAIMPKHQIYAAMALTAGSYLLLTGYDFLALCYVRRQLGFRDVMFASFTAFAFSNNLGFQLLSGGSMRYRIYSNLGLRGGEIVGIVAFCTFTYALGAMTIAGLVFAFSPAEVALLLKVPRPIISAAGLSMLTFIIAYLAVAAMWRGRIAFGRFRLRPPTLPLALAQVVLASVDAVLAGTVFYVLLPVDVQLSFESYLGIYMIAATTSVLSLVPGGIGVFETVITLVGVVPSKAAALGAFLAYRLIYFVAPFVVAIVWFMLHEMGRITKKG